jgi:arylsulfatase
MHIYTHLRPEHRLLAAPYSSAEDVYGSGMMELDRMVGRMVDHLEMLGVADDTIILFTSDNGAMSAWWPDGGTTPFRGEKATTWEGGVRVPMLVRWPARIPEGSVSNGIQSHLDLFTTLAAAAGVPDVARKLEAQNGVKIDGLDNLPAWTAGKPSARDVQLMYNEDQLTALRIGPWKIHRQTRFLRADGAERPDLQPENGPLRAARRTSLEPDRHEEGVPWRPDHRCPVGALPLARGISAPSGGRITAAAIGDA